MLGPKYLRIPKVPGCQGVEGSDRQMVGETFNQYYNLKVANFTLPTLLLNLLGICLLSIIR